MKYTKENIDQILEQAGASPYSAESMKLYLAAIAKMMYNEYYGEHPKVVEVGEGELKEILKYALKKEAEKHEKEKVVVKGETKKAGPGPKKEGRAADAKTSEKTQGGKGSPAGKAGRRK